MSHSFSNLFGITILFFYFGNYKFIFFTPKKMIPKVRQELRFLCLIVINLQLSGVSFLFSQNLGPKPLTLEPFMDYQSKGLG